MKEHPYLPCPMHVTTKEGKEDYCQMGNLNHFGTCVGGKSKATYDHEMRNAREQMRARAA